MKRIKSATLVIFLVALVLGMTQQAQAQCCGGPGSNGFPAELQQFLDLNEKQIVQINQINADFSNFLNAEFDQINQIGQDLNVLTQVNDLDAAQFDIGAKYVAILKINRIVNAQHNVVNQQVVDLLHDDQLQKLKFLQKALDRQAELYEALGANMLLYPQGPYAGGGGPKPQQAKANQSQPSAAYQFFAKKLNW